MHNATAINNWSYASMLSIGHDDESRQASTHQVIVFMAIITTT